MAASSPNEFQRRQVLRERLSRYLAPRSSSIAGERVPVLTDQEVLDLFQDIEWPRRNDTQWARRSYDEARRAEGARQAAARSTESADSNAAIMLRICRAMGMSTLNIAPLFDGDPPGTGRAPADKS